MMERIAALTSLPPGTDRVAHYRDCIASWQAAGMEVFSFNHPDEIGPLRARYDVHFVPVAHTAIVQLGRPYIPITRMLDWAAARDRTVFLVNADIEVRLTPWELKRLQWISRNALCYFVRHNYSSDIRVTSRELYGVDAFLLGSAEACQLPDSFLSMGAPFWDYLIPYHFACRQSVVHAVESPVLFHKDHPRQWSSDAWHRCALEFDRICALMGEDRSYGACMGMAGHVHTYFDSRKRLIPTQPTPIRRWLRERFANPEPKTFLEVGAHDGSDTVWMAGLPGVSLHAFEPDPRNCPPSRDNVTLIRAAVSDQDGRLPFLLSETGWGRPWTHSFSLKRPKNHLTRFPVSFGATVEVDAVTLDRYARERGLGTIDFIWADVQGAEGELICGGRNLLQRTRYFYTAYSDEESYEGQVCLAEICAMLPEFRVVELWPYEVLLENVAI
jgi:FkbM family methyltransferase